MNQTSSTERVIEKNLNRYHLRLQDSDLALDIEDFVGEEGLSEIYCYTIRFTSSHQDIRPQQILRKNGLFTLRTPHDILSGVSTSLPAVKTVHGVIVAFRRLSGSRDQVSYEIELKPFLSLLDKQFRTHRFFVNKSIPEVVSQVLTEHGLKSWEFAFQLTHSYPTREQINQYQESDLAFIQRLLAEVGIFFFFTLQPETQTEVVHFADSQSALTFDKTLPLNSPSGLSDSGADSVWALNVAHNVVEATVFAKDYNPRQAHDLLQSAVADMTRGDGAGLSYGEVYHYRPRHQECGDKQTPEPETANFYARLEHERFLVNQTLITGESTDATLNPGQVLTITDSQPPTLPVQLCTPLVIIRLTFTASRSNALHTRLKAVPYSDTLCWRPALLPRPKVTGTLTARVTSARSNDIYAWQDALGQYRVQFDADQDEKEPGQESLPVRLAKPYAGDVYGFHFPLIQGSEVAIAFQEGDPDRPYIAYALHDSRHPDPVTERNSTRNVLRTAGKNKLRMEDKRDQEHIKLSTEFGGKTQLNLGHNVDAQSHLRGAGAELRSDEWVSIRGGKGILLSADAQPKAQGQMLDMQEAIRQLEQAQTLTEALRAGAETARAELADLKTQKALLKETLDELKQSALLLSAPAGIAASSPQSIQLSAGENIIATSGQQLDISVLKKFTLAAGEIISLFAQKMGIKLFASQGKVQIQAQGDEMALDALKDICISSSEGKVVISARQEILLMCGGGYIRIADGTVECAAPDKIIARAAVWQKFNGQSVSAKLNQYQQRNYKLQPQLVAAGTYEGVINRAAGIKSDSGAVVENTTITGETSRQHYTHVTRAEMRLDQENPHDE